MKSLKLNDKTVEKIKYEIRQLDKLFQDSNSLFNVVQIREPDFIEKSAAALVLHSFYNGVENILQIIHKELDDDIPEKNKWHRALLEFSFIDTGRRKKVFRESLKEPLNEYLAFRHFIRHSYGFEIVWEKMKPLFLNLQNVWNDVRNDLIFFMQ